MSPRGRASVVLVLRQKYLTGINLGLRLTPGEEIREAVYPEIGLFTTPDGHYCFYFGMALSFTFGGP